MSCESYERWIALLVSKDLPPRRAARLETHLTECTRCRALAGDMARSRTLLRQPEDNLKQDAAFARVRARTLAALEGGRHATAPWSPWPPTLRWALPVAVVLFLAAALAAWWLKQTPFAIPPPVLDKQARLTTLAPVPPSPPEPAQTRAMASPTSPVHPAPSREGPTFRTPNPRPTGGAVPQTAEVKPSPPMLIRLETADPQVVIYWIVDEKPPSKREVSHG